MGNCGRAPFRAGQRGTITPRGAALIDPLLGLVLSLGRCRLPRNGCLPPWPSDVVMEKRQVSNVAEKDQ